MIWFARTRLSCPRSFRGQVWAPPATTQQWHLLNLDRSELEFVDIDLVPLCGTWAFNGTWSWKFGNKKQLRGCLGYILVIGGKVCGLSFHLHLKCLGVLGMIPETKCLNHWSWCFRLGLWSLKNCARKVIRQSDDQFVWRKVTWHWL